MKIIQIDCMSWGLAYNERGIRAGIFSPIFAMARVERK